MDINNPLVSVLIPAYNHEKFVQETIRSIINQTYKNIELIVLDDGSKDSTWQRIQELKEACEKRFARVYFETKANEGTAKTQNKLIDMAQGEYIYLIASDDISKPEAIETEINFLEKNKDYALCVGDNEIIDSSGVKCYWDKDRNIIYDKNKAKYKTFVEFLESRKHFRFTGKKFGTYETIYQANYIPNGYLIRKEVFDDFRYTTEAPLEDFYLMLYISKYYKMKFINKVLFSYRWHDSNTIKNDEKMKEYTRKTRMYEDEIFQRIDKERCFPRLLEYFDKGVLYKYFGCPCLFEVKKYRNHSTKIIIVKLFNFQIYKKTKNIKRSL